MWLSLPFSRMVLDEANRTNNPLVAAPKEFKVECWWIQVYSPMRGVTERYVTSHSLLKRGALLHLDCTPDVCTIRMLPTRFADLVSHSGAPSCSNLCNSVDLFMTDKGVQMMFHGGSLCPGEVLMGGLDGVMFTVKHKRYLQLEVGPTPLQVCTPFLKAATIRGHGGGVLADWRCLWCTGSTRVATWVDQVHWRTTSRRCPPIA